MSEKIKRTYHPNGQLMAELTLVNGVANGVSRRWYSNGVLETEATLKDGQLDGTVRCWGSDGKYWGSYEMRHGTGVSLVWYPDGSLQSEIPFIKGVMCGRQRAWFEDGKLAVQVYWLRGRKVSKKNYLEACGTDSSLPRYDQNEESWEEEMKREFPLATPLPEHPLASKAAQEKIASYLSEPVRNEARSWLRAASETESRTLGELPDNEESIVLVEEAYAAGAIEVLVVKITHADGIGLNSGTLLVRLPGNGEKRLSALAWCNEQNAFQGYDPTGDVGQEWVEVQLD